MCRAHLALLLHGSCCSEQSNDPSEAASTSTSKPKPQSESTPTQSPEARVINSAEQLSECRQLQGEAMLALDCEGVNLGRLGTLSLIQIGTGNGDIFLFDVLRCSPESEVVQWLKPILENESVIKIMHDCRKDSDALYHLLGISLACVHDTQVCAEDERNLNDTLQRCAQSSLQALHSIFPQDAFSGGCVPSLVGRCRSTVGSGARLLLVWALALCRCGFDEETFVTAIVNE